MTKKKQAGSGVFAVQDRTAYQHRRGSVRDNAVFALLHDPLFRRRVEKKLKGKGSYQRKPKFVKAAFEKPDYKIFFSEIL